MGATSTVDLLIVGAGSAGLGAARTARGLGLSFLVLEATDRIGGRAFTDPAPFGVPWDRGCHWLHSASVNPFRAIADDLGVSYRPESIPWRLHLGDRWATDAEAAAINESADVAWGAVQSAAREGRDVALSDVVDRSSPGLAAFASSIHAEWGVGLDQASTVDTAAYRDTHENWPVEDGYGTLVARHAGDLPVTLSTPVDTIDWSGPELKIATRQGTIAARAAIVTASTSALAAGMVRFVPELPDWKQEAFVAVPLGTANKVGLKIEGAQLGVAGPVGVSVPLADGTRVGLRLRPFGWDLVDVYLAGPVATELERAGEATAVETAISLVETIYGSDIRSQIEATASTAWGREPFIRGGYAAAKPGQAHRRGDLGRPVGERLFFAGEATSPEFYSTCHGAWQSGEAAAQAVVKTIGRS